MHRAAAPPKSGGRHPKGVANEAPIGGRIRESEDDSHGPSGLSAPVCHLLHGEHSGQREQLLGRRQAQHRAPPDKRAPGHAEFRGRASHGERPSGPGQRESRDATGLGGNTTQAVGNHRPCHGSHQRRQHDRIAGDAVARQGCERKAGRRRPRRWFPSIGQRWSPGIAADQLVQLVPVPGQDHRPEDGRRGSHLDGAPNCLAARAPQQAKHRQHVVHRTRSK